MNKIDLNNKTAIITGGAQGFGFAMTKRFLDSGAEVIIWDIDKKTIAEGLKNINSPKLSASIIDITDFEKVSQEVKKITSDKNIDIFVNNAGIAGKNSTVAEYPIDEWKKVLELDLNAVFIAASYSSSHD